MGDVHGSPGDAPQMPQAMTAGPAPVPYGGGDQGPEPPVYSAPGFADAGGATSAVLAGVSGNGVQESSYAHDVNAGLVVPYVAGAPSGIYTGGDADAGGRDDVAGTVAGAVGNAEARWHEFQSDIYPLGSSYGDLMTLPPVPEDIVVPPGGFGYPMGNQPGA